MSEAEYVANAQTQFFHAVDPLFNEDVYAPPCMETGGVQTHGYIEDGTYRVSVDLETAGALFRKYGPDGDLVPLVVTVNGEVVFEARPVPGSCDLPETIAVMVAVARPRRTARNLWGLLG
jgi:hypothetical protein